MQTKDVLIMYSLLQGPPTLQKMKMKRQKINQQNVNITRTAAMLAVKK
jgi:hypothetical protein